MIVRALGLYYVATGIWPIVHLRSFLAVTGPKREDWLVQTFGGLVAAIGVVLVQRPRDRAAARLATLAAAVLATADTWFVARGRIRPVYLADAVVEAATIVALARRDARRPLAPIAPGAGPDDRRREDVVSR